VCTSLAKKWHILRFHDIQPNGLNCDTQHRHRLSLCRVSHFLPSGWMLRRPFWCFVILAWNPLPVRPNVRHYLFYFLFKPPHSGKLWARYKCSWPNFVQLKNLEQTEAGIRQTSYENLTIRAPTRIIARSFENTRLIWICFTLLIAKHRQSQRHPRSNWQKRRRQRRGNELEWNGRPAGQVR
jgi:hypothetical protein